MLSQCATERMNKVPKEVWAADRRALTPEHMARDVFVTGNMKDYYPEIEFLWT